MLANNKEYEHIKKHLNENLVEKAKKRLNKVYALVINQNVFELSEKQVSEGYQIFHTYSITIAILFS